MIEAILIESETGFGLDPIRVGCRVHPQGLETVFKAKNHKKAITVDRIWLYHNGKQFGQIDIEPRLIGPWDLVILEVKSAFEDNPIKRIN